MPATSSASSAFQAIRTVGGLLPADMLARIADGRDVSASKPADYHIVGNRSVKDEAERHWDYLKGAWRALRDTLGPTGTVAADLQGLAVENWLLPLFDELAFGRLGHSGPQGIAADDGTTTFPVTHSWGHVPIHLVPWDAELDKRIAGVGLPPQSMLQECLNRTKAHLWGIVSNGRQLRILRDSSALAGTAYIEIDLEAMFDGELVNEFVVLYRLLHVSRFEVTPDDAAPSTCRLERWRTEAIESGARVLDQLREGVREAITQLGTGYIRHEANAQLREDLDPQLLKRALLRLVYRLLFWFVAEERGVLHPPGTDDKTRQRYSRYFSAKRLRETSLRRFGTTHCDLWQAVQFVLASFARDDGRTELGLPGLGGIYDDTETDRVLTGLQLSNEYLIRAIRALSQFYDAPTRRNRRVDYLHLGAEELGSIYESLLELDPKWSREERTFVLNVVPGNERKGTGSYYTPTSLIDCLLDSTLDPVLDDAQKRAELQASQAERDVPSAIAKALLQVTVCDPACGSGHFLVAAARRIAKRVASVREHNPEPTEEALRHALREVIAHCVYGVDVNPMAVELTKVSLWLEALEPGKALSFLDSRVKVGNALIGATPALINKGIPDGAFKPVEGDDPAFARSLERANAERQQRTAAQKRAEQGMFFTNKTALPGLEPEWGQDALFGDVDLITQSNEELADALARIAQAPDESLHEVHEQGAAYAKWLASAERHRKRLIADAWCAAFMWIKTPKAPPAIVNRTLRELTEGGPGALLPATARELERLREEYSFFHWHLEFPDVFRVPDPHADVATGWGGGFSCVLGNPPWDKVDFKEKEYFSAVEPSIATLAGKARKDAITEWEKEHEEEGERYRAARRVVKSGFLFASSSDAFLNTAKGLKAAGVNSLQKDQLFAELFSLISAPTGRAGCIIPTAIATGASGQYLFDSLAGRGGVTSLYGFENRKPFFPAVDSRYPFCLLSLAGKEAAEPAARFAFFLLDVVDLDDANRVFTLSPDEIAFINPNSRTLPIFRTRREAALTADIQGRIPVLWNESKQDGNPWGTTFKNLFNMADDSDLFRDRERLVRDGWHLSGNVFTRGKERMLPLYEAKMVGFFNHRAADVVKSATAVDRQNQPRYLTTQELQDPARLAVSLNWIAEDGRIRTRRSGKDTEIPGVSERLTDLEWEHNWLCGWCDVTSATNERTAIPAFFPRTAVGHSLPLMLPRVPAGAAAALIAAQSSLVFDFVARQKVGGNHLNLFILKQLPVPTPSMLKPHLPFIVPRVLELVYTAYDVTPLARDLGDEGAPFVWDEDRRARIRAELDAFFFRMYGIGRDDADYIMETFPIVRGNDIKEHGTYRTKDWVLAEYDRMTSIDPAANVGTTYESPLNPPPGHGRRHPAQSV